MGSHLRLLLDTHALIWWLAGDDALSRRARDAIADEANEIIVSAASTMEIATKFRIGKLPGAAHAGKARLGVEADGAFRRIVDRLVIKGGGMGHSR